ncbi:MAG TPA: DMT family transporter [Thermoanaerobaculia bacterium]|nr:DMT family transporter [Thermoanaerobaculia bacterium]
MSAPQPSNSRSASRSLAYLALLVTFLIWSNSFIAVRALVGEDVPDAERLGPLELVEARFVPVALWCLGWFLLLPAARAEARRILASHPLQVLFLGLLSVWTYNLAFAVGHHRVPAGTGSLFTVLNPVLTFFLTVALGQERATWLKVAGLALAIVGLYTVVIHGSGRMVEPAYLRDALILVGAPASWSLCTTFSKPLVGRFSPLHLNFLVLGLASLPTLPLALADRGFQARVAAWTLPRYGAALFLALACTVLAFWLWYEALQRLPASTAAAFVFLNAPMTVAFEWLWFGRVPRPVWWLGCAVVLAGVYLCTRDRDPLAEQPRSARA